MNQTISINPETKAQYPIPAAVDDKANIEAFLAKFPGRKVVVVQGLGFVGAVMSIVCANADGADYAVIGVDLPTPQSWWKICEINAGHFPIRASDPNVELYFERARAKGNFYATADPYAYNQADVIIVDVNLDVDKQNNEINQLQGFTLNMNGFRQAIEAIGMHCREDVLVVVETTVPPGTCQQVVYPLIKQCFNERGLPTALLRVGHSYERVMPGPDYVDSIRNFYRVYSGIDDASANATEKFLKTIISTEKYPLTRLGSTNATEMAKVLENSYRAMNIAFMVEWTRFAEEAGVNLYEVVNAIRQRPTHANMMFPGVGVGGYCLTKDALMASWARQHMFGTGEPLQQSETGVYINDLMPWYAFNFMIEKIGKPLKNINILLLGVSYRSDVGDTRYSPVEYLHRLLKNEGANISMHDPYVRYWEELQLEVPVNLNELLKNEFDVLVFSTAHGAYKTDEGIYTYVDKHPDCYVFDLLGVVPEGFIRSSKNRRIKVLGRGDI
jgi:UDP-N-acetyl-D-glucosamine dehydrogenase